MRLWIAGLMLATALLAPLHLVQAQALDKAAVEEIVKTYIANNGEALMTSLQAAEKREQRKLREAMIGKNTPTRGPANAPVTIVEFSDYQCPYCVAVQPTLNEVAAKYGNKVRWVFKNFPLEMHEQAKPAAAAALAANMQGKFWEYHREIWTKRGSLSDATLLEIAKKVKLDVAKFNKDRASEAVRTQIETDMLDAQKAQLRGTPFFIIGDTPLSGAVPVNEFTKLIDAALKDAGK